MKVLRSLFDVSPADLDRAPASVVTVGNFDGVHLGHAKVLSATVEKAARKAAVSVAVTFDPHPAALLSPETAPPILTRTPRKVELMAAVGIGVVVIQPFTHRFASLSPEEFVGHLAEQLRVRVLCVGRDFRFGRARKGDWRTLRSLAAEVGAGLHRVPPVTVGGVTVSSSAVREALGAGDVRLAARMLGRPHEVDGEVVRGSGRGGSLGYPTANVDAAGMCLPAEGVYAGQASIGDLTRAALISYGRRHTFGEDRPLLEVHLLDADGDFYGGRMRVGFQTRLRDQRGFADPEALKEQLARDEQQARLAAGPAPKPVER